MAAGIEPRHRKGCPAVDDGRCRCTPTYRAWVWSNKDGTKIRKTFPTIAAAKAWRSDAQAQLNAGALRASTATIRDAWAAWLDGARAGLIRNRSGDPYKPAAIRGYEKAFRLRVEPRLGAVKLGDLRVPDVQEFVDAMLADEMAPATIDVTLNPLRAIYRRAIQRGEVATNPTRGVSLPANRNRRDRFADPEEAERLLDALPDADRAIWATALYAGLRRGELMALRWSRVDLASGLIHVEASWDPSEGEVGLKSRAGKRKVPIPAILRDHLDRLEPGEGLIFGQTPSRPFGPTRLTETADEAWKAAGLKRITLHECRHTYASLMIAAGVNAKALATYLGHANIAITLDLYGHLMPGNEGEAADLLDVYLRRSGAEAARLGPPVHGNRASRSTALTP